MKKVIIINISCIVELYFNFPKDTGLKSGLYEESGDKRNQDDQEEENRKKAYGANQEKWNEASHSGYDGSNIDKDDLIEELKLFKAVCDNIKYTLAEIKSYSKVTLMSDSKASYFTIVDAVLSGPKEINPDDLMSVLGVSKNSFDIIKVYSSVVSTSIYFSSKVFFYLLSIYKVCNFISRSVTTLSQESKDLVRELKKKQEK